MSSSKADEIYHPKSRIALRNTNQVKTRALTDMASSVTKPHQARTQSSHTINYIGKGNKCQVESWQDPSPQHQKPCASPRNLRVNKGELPPETKSVFREATRGEFMQAVHSPPVLKITK